MLAAPPSFCLYWDDYSKDTFGRRSWRVEVRHIAHSWLGQLPWLLLCLQNKVLARIPHFSPFVHLKKRYSKCTKEKHFVHPMITQIHQTALSDHIAMNAFNEAKKVENCTSETAETLGLEKLLAATSLNPDRFPPSKGISTSQYYKVSLCHITFSGKPDIPWATSRQVSLSIWGNDREFSSYKYRWLYEPRFSHSQVSLKR